MVQAVHGLISARPMKPNQDTFMVQKERREENIFEGRNALEREFRRNNIRVPEEELEDFLKMDMHRHSCDTLDDFFAAIGYGGVQLSKVMQRLKSEYNKKYGEKAQPDTSDLEIR